MDGYSRHTPSLSGVKVARTIIIDSSMLPHVGGSIGELTLNHIWTKVGDDISDIVDESFAIVESWYQPVMVGQIAAFLGAIPGFWLPLAGGTYDENDYPELFQTLDSQYKDEQAGTFNLPDFSDLFLVGALGDYALGATGGESLHTLLESEIPSHSHTYIPPIVDVDLEAPGAPDIAAARLGTQTTTGDTGGGDPHENKPPYIAVTYGIFSGRNL